MSSSAIGVAGGKSAKTSRQQKGNKQTRTNPTTLKQPAQDNNQYQVPYQQQQQQPQQVSCSSSANMAVGPYAATQVPFFYNQPMPLGQYGGGGGAHTISRASNLYKHFANEGQPTSMKNQLNGGPQLVYYDQPYSGYANGGPIVGATPLLANSGPCPGAAMSLSVREPKERGPIPFVNGGGTIGPALMRQYAAEQRRCQQQRHSMQLIYQEAPLFGPLELGARFNKPLCRCRVMYLGSSVPHITKNGLHGIQEPLKHLYPEEKFSSNSLRRRTAQRQQQQQNMTIDISHLSASLGIDSWLSVWSNGLLLENVDEFGRDIRRFFSIESLHYCAAVRYFDTSTLEANKADSSFEQTGQDLNNNTGQEDSLNSSGLEQDQENRKPGIGTRDAPRTNQPRRAVRFLPLDAPIFQYPNMMDPNHPPLFAAIMRRTSGVKVLECHAFICRRDAASNALVRCCTHAYADFLSAKRMSAEFGADPAPIPFNAGLLNANRAGPNHYQAERGQLDGRRAAPSSQRNSIPAELVSLRTSSKRQDGEQRGRKPARSLSTGGTNSQEMTHSDENSLDAADSEDNYAIIMRQSVGGHENATPVTKPAGWATTKKIGRGAESRDSHRRRASRSSAKGSSKSLFRGFMPSDQLTTRMPLNEAANDSASNSSRRRPGKAHRLASLDSTNLRAGDRLSQSLDFIQVPNSSSTGSATCCPAAAAVGIWPDRDSVQHRDSVKYSIVANKQRRHSKSMQQLVRVPNATEASKEPEASARISFAWTRAASCQDIARRGSLSRSSSISSHHRQRRRSQRQRRQSGSRRSSASSHTQNSIVGSQSKLNKLAAEQRHQHQQDQRVHTRARQVDTSACIYATCSSGESEPLPVLLPPPPFAQPIETPASHMRISHPGANQQQAVSSSSSSGSTRAKKSSRRHREQHQQQSAGALNSTSAFVDPVGGYYHFMQPPPPPLPPAPFNQHRASCYNPAGLIYCTPTGQPPFYGAAPQMGVPPPPPQPAAYYPFHHQQPQLFAAPPDSSLYNGAYLLPNTSKSATMKRPSSKASKEALAATLKRDSKLARKSQTLATRFRCLSPPLSFLSDGPDRHNVAPPPTIGVTQQEMLIEQQQVDSNNNNQNRQSVSSQSSRATSTSNSCQVSPGHIVSGKPGFMGASASNQMAPMGTPKNENSRDRPKMSWIKRLSLTLSSGSSVNTRQTPKSSASRAEQAAEFYRNIQEIEQPQELRAASNEPDNRLEAPESSSINQNFKSQTLGEPYQANHPIGESSQPNQNSDPTPETQFESISRQAETSEKPQDEQTKSKRKKGGFFSGSLTLGRKSRVKSSP